MSQGTRIIRVLCADSKGIISSISGLLSDYGGNITDLEQHSEQDTGLFAMRLVVEGLRYTPKFRKDFLSLNLKDFKYWINDPDQKLKMAVLVTRESGCLYELLIKRQSGDLNCEIPLIISNHKYCAHVSRDFGIPFLHLPVTSPENKKYQEAHIQDALTQHGIDLVVLARYMQILTPYLTDQWTGRMINIHHSFLPAFKGGRPYHQAWQRGVKCIGATAHYVTTDLDEGPIIHQAVQSVSHRHSVKGFIQAGADIERSVLYMAVRAHIEHRIILTGNRTIVFY